ncbi:MAG: hypothetical protein R2909_20670 [Gemmatimonadales bacterium]
MKLTTRFGQFGGAFVLEILVPALEELEAAWCEARRARLPRGACSAARNLRRPAHAALSLPPLRR